RERRDRLRPARPRPPARLVLARAPGQHARRGHPAVRLARGRAVPPARLLMGSAARLEVLALDGIPEVRPGDDLARMLLTAYAPHAPADGDILVVTSKIVSKAEGRIVRA